MKEKSNADREAFRKVGTYLEQWTNLSKQVAENMAPAFKAQEEFRKSLESTAGIGTAFNSAVKALAADQNRIRSMFQSIRVPEINPEFMRFARQAAEFQRNIAQLTSSAFEKIQESFLELPPKTREALLVLGQHGWYLDMEMPATGIWRIRDALVKGSVGEVETALIAYYEERLDGIENSITKKFPNRARILHAGFNAHRREEYSLCIPVFLAQTDGICKEMFDQHLFLKHNKKPQTAIYVEQIASDGYLAALLSPLADTLPISASERQRDKNSRALNRHAVLHGESLDYDSKLNSLKAISLINYVAHVVENRAGNA